MSDAEVTEWIDVAVTVRPGMPHWPDNPPIVLQRVMDTGRGDICTSSTEQPGWMRCHHADAAKIHKILLQAGIWIIEGLDLSPVTGGRYELICLPGKLHGSDGAPARAILRPMGPGQAVSVEAAS